jgi:branched-subunit amino acid transport protein
MKGENKTVKALISVIVMALVTYFIRALPVTVFRKEIKSPFLKSFLYYVPYAVLSSLTFPAVFFSTGNVTTAVLGTLTALVLAYCEKGLVTAAVAAIIIVCISGVFF